MSATWLIDKSAYARLDTTPDADTWAERIELGLVRIATGTRLETRLFSPVGGSGPG